MKRSLYAAGALGLCVAVTAAASSGGPRLVAHEWGTFTSIAGEDGRAVQWLPQAGPPDLPCFVERVDTRLKWGLSGTVRMETPVIYFYADRPMNVDVSVRFRQGVITEWFPRPGGVGRSAATAAGALRGEMSWRSIAVTPGGGAQFPTEHSPSHYYAARKTDAAPLRVHGEEERFLFYRGVGRLPPPITAAISNDGQIVVTQTRGEALGDIMLFENRDGATAFQSLHTSSARAAFNPVEPNGEGAAPQMHLKKVLVAHGLYQKEADAMVESWRDSWFEQGTRLFYILSGAAVDTVLPLEIAPTPFEIKRVFVGRMEIATPATLDELKVALETHDRARLQAYGRFIDPLARRLLATVSGAERAALERKINNAYGQFVSVPGTCSATTN